jgi:hypothetical protein
MAVADYYRDEGDELRAQAWVALIAKEPKKIGSHPVSWWWYSIGWREESKHLLPKEWVRSIDGVSNADRSPVSYKFGILDAFLEAVEGYVVWKSGGK